MERIEQYDTVLLGDGRIGAVVEVYGDQDKFDVDVGDSPSDWETLYLDRSQIVKVIQRNS